MSISALSQKYIAFFVIFISCPILKYFFILESTPMARTICEMWQHGTKCSRDSAVLFKSGYETVYSKTDIFLNQRLRGL
jgi:hypothetical protein